jgi:hypothetical protein
MGVIAWSWLLALLVFGSAWGPILARVSGSGLAAGCSSGSHACCCIKAGQVSCACDGHAGAAAQMASLSSCAGANELPSFLISPPAAMLPPTGVALAEPVPTGFVFSQTLNDPQTAPPVPPPPPPQV